MKKDILTIKGKPMTKNFVGIILFHHARYHQENTWNFVDQYPHGGAGNYPNLQTLAVMLTFKGYSPDKYNFDEPPDTEIPEGLSQRWFAVLPREWKIELDELIKKELAKLVK
jgi:hypothetical protein